MVSINAQHFLVSKGHRFWRVVNEAHLPRSWVINQIKFYSDKHARHPIAITNPNKAFASSSYTGYMPSEAFDNSSKTYWLPNGWYDRGPGEDFIGYEFDHPVAINSIRIVHQSGQGQVVSKKMYVEAADAFGGPYATKWIIENKGGKSNKRFNNKSKRVIFRDKSSVVNSIRIRCSISEMYPHTLIQLEYRLWWVLPIKVMKCPPKYIPQEIRKQQLNPKLRNFNPVNLAIANNELITKIAFITARIIASLQLTLVLQTMIRRFEFTGQWITFFKIELARNYSQSWLGFLEAWLALTSVNYHRKL